MLWGYVGVPVGKFDLSLPKAANLGMARVFWSPKKYHSKTERQITAT